MSEQPDHDHEEVSDPQNLLPIDEHIEEGQDTAGRRVPLRGVYLLPNLFTTANLFVGFYSITHALRGQYSLAAASLFVAMVFDAFAGRVARLTNTQSAFGAEYDSLSDMIAFGIAPALLAYSWALGDLGKVGWMVSFVYVAGAALRLARFNTQIGKVDKRYFTGLASPAAAGLVAGIVWALDDLDVKGNNLVVPMAVIVAAAGLLMVTNIRYYSFKDLNLRGRVPFVTMLAMVLAIAIVSTDPPRILALLFVIYAAYGPLQYILCRYRKKRTN